MRRVSSSGRSAKGTQRAAFHEAGRLAWRAAPAKRPRPQFAIVAQRCRRCGGLALLCSLGFRLAASPTGGARLRPRHTRFVRLAGRSVMCYTSPNEEEPIAPVTRWVPPALWAARLPVPYGYGGPLCGARVRGGVSRRTAPRRSGWCWMRGNPCLTMPPKRNRP